jgi:hypothetical protein
VTIRDAAGAFAEVEVDIEESPLAWLRRRRQRDGSPLVDDAQFAAGERLRRDFTFGQLMPSTTTNWSAFGEPRRPGGPGRGGAADLGEAASAARERVSRALGAVGPELADVLVDVCCFLKGLGDLERSRDWPARSGKLVLTIALTALARHYGLAVAAKGPAGAAMRQWGAEDFRPKA